MARNKRRAAATDCPKCGGELVDGACAFCPPDIDADRDQEFAELDSYFRPGRTD